MFGLGGSEMILLGVVALIVIGPKDLPGLFRTIGQFTGKARAMASEFSRAMEAAADDSGVKDISKTIQAAANPKKFGLDQARKATGIGATAGPATAALSAERQAAKDKIAAKTAETAEARRAREQAQFEADSADLLADHEPEPEPEPELAEAEPQKDKTTT